tara:strand:- start:264 stop:482 length:219 start_codon:yes stop_codon:yes gene_type:complete
MTDIDKLTEFLKVQSGDTVLLGEDEIAKVITCIGGSRDSDVPTLFQAANSETGAIHWVHAGEEKDIVIAIKS